MQISQRAIEGIGTETVYKDENSDVAIVESNAFGVTQTFIEAEGDLLGIHTQISSPEDPLLFSFNLPIASDQWEEFATRGEQILAAYSQYQKAKAQRRD